METAYLAKNALMALTNGEIHVFNAYSEHFLDVVVTHAVYHLWYFLINARIVDFTMSRRKPSLKLRELSESEDYWEMADSEERRLRKCLAQTARRQAETPQQAEARRLRDNLDHRASREAENPQEAEARRLRDNLDHRASREAETPQEADEVAERQYCSRSESKS